MDHSRAKWISIALSSLSLMTGCKSNPRATQSAPGSITVLRVESSGPDRPGAEHCPGQGQACTPLAVSQKLVPQGVVRTFAGGKVSLDFGQGRRVDLDSLSQLELDQKTAHLKEGNFSLDTIPLIAKEQDGVQPSDLSFTVSGRSFRASADQPMTAALSVGKKETLLTVRRGRLESKDLEESPRPGQTIRLTSARTFRTTADGAELPSLTPIVPRRSEFGDLLSEMRPRARHGLGTMSARLPNTTQKRDGVRLLKHHAKVSIVDGYATTQIEEEFENTTPHVLEGQYRFAVPADASLARLGLWVGDHLMEGEVLERDRAAAIYRSIVDRPVPRDPALLEWENGGEMSLKVFPILPKKTRRVLLAYHQSLSSEGGLLRYVYPLSLGSERSTHIDDFSIEVVARDAKAKLSQPRVISHDAQVGQENGQIYARFSARDFTPSHDFSLSIEREQDESAQLSASVDVWESTQLGVNIDPPLLKRRTQPSPVAGSPTTRSLVAGSPTTRSPRAKEGFFGLRLRVDLPHDAPRPALAPLARAIVLDLSHSQSEETIRAQTALAFGLLLELDPEEPFVLLACDSACEAWDAETPGVERASTAALPARLAGAHAFLSRLEPGGSSDVAGALAAASVWLSRLEGGADRKLQLVYLGDGRASSGELSSEAIASRVRPLLDRSGIELRFVEVGHALDHDLIRGLAVELGGTWDTLASGRSLDDRIWELAGAFRRPIIKNPQLALPPGLIAVESRALPALRLGQEIIVAGEITSFEGGTVTLTGQLGGQDYKFSRAIDFEHGEKKSNPLIATLWAKNRISLLQSLAPTESIRAEIIDLSKRFRTMSRYTSFLVLESHEMYEQFGIDRPAREEERGRASGYTDDAGLRFDREQLEQQADLSAAEAASDEAAAPFFAGDNAQSRSAPNPSRTARASSRSASSPAGGSLDAEHLQPRSAVPPTPAAPKPSARPSAGLGLDPLDGLAEGKSESIGSGAGGPSKGAQVPRFRLPPEPIEPPHDNRMSLRMAAPRFHLRATSESDEWRKWGQENLDQLRRRLDAAPESRARHEALVRGLLQGGRFIEAHEAAQDFFRLDPDHMTAVRLFGASSVVTENHEQARLMLDVENELLVDQLHAHLEAARAFLAVGDLVRACAHARSVAALDPRDENALLEANSCWDEVLGKISPREKSLLGPGEPGQIEVTVECNASTDARDCPSPVIVTPFGEVYSPWTPGQGKTDRQRITLLKLRSGDYHLLVAGGSPEARGTLKVIGRHENTSLNFQGGSLHTVAKMTLSYY